MLFAQIDGGVVTALLESASAPTVLPPGRSFVIAPDGVACGDNYNGVTFTRPKTPARFADDVTRLLKKTGA